jgi:hypothetical protein
MSNDTDRRQSEAKYDIGYGKPPKVGCFRPGESGNPRGRPRKKKDQETKSLAATFAGALEEEVTVTDGTKQIRITRKQLMVRSLVEKSAKGGKRALRKLLTLRDAVEKHADGPIVMTMCEITAMAARPKITHLKEPVWFVNGKDIPVGAEDAPKIAPSFKQLIEIELDRQVWVTGPGPRRRMTMRDIIATQFTNAAAGGDEGTIELLLKFGIHRNPDPNQPKIRIMVKPSTPEQYWHYEHRHEWEENYKKAGEPLIESDEQFLSFYPPMPK